MTSTLDYYDRTAERYAQVNHTLSAPQPDRDAFIARLREREDQTPVRALRVLDAGSGSGRDTLAFLAQGVEVDAFDGSASMAQLSSRLTGQTTSVMRFEDLDLPEEKYDGIWAMASLLHVPRAQLPEVMAQLGRSLRPGGLFYASFKYGASERQIEGAAGPERRFTDINEAELTTLLDQVEGLSLVSTACSQPPPTQSNPEPWFSCTLQRTGPVYARQPSKRKPRP